MFIKKSEQDFRCILCKKEISENISSLPDDQLPATIEEGEVVETYYLIGKVRAGKKTGNGCIVACETCWHEYSGIEVEDDYDVRRKHKKLLADLREALQNAFPSGTALP